MIGRPVFSILMITIGLGTILHTAVIVIWGSNPIPAAAPYTITSGFNIGGIHFGLNDLLTIIVTIILCAILFYFFQYTRYGLAMRPTVLDQEAALAVGINIRTVYPLAWGIAAAVATIGEVLRPACFHANGPELGGSALHA